MVVAIIMNDWSGIYSLSQRRLEHLLLTANYEAFGAQRHITQHLRDFPNLLCKLQPIFADEKNGSEEAQNGYPRATHQGRDRDGERGTAPTQGISSWSGGGGDGKENKAKPRCITSFGGLQPSRFVTYKAPRSLKLRFPLPLFFPGSTEYCLGAGGQVFRQLKSPSLTRMDPQVSKSRG